MFKRNVEFEAIRLTHGSIGSRCLSLLMLGVVPLLIEPSAHHPFPHIDIVHSCMLAVC